MKKILLTLLGLAVSNLGMAGDLTITYQVNQGGHKGEKIIYWSDQYHFTADKTNKQDTLVDFNKNTMYLIDHSKKTIEYMNLDQMAGMMDQSGGMMEQMMNMKVPGKKENVSEMMQNGMEKNFGKSDSGLQKLGTLQIAGRTCDDYSVLRKGKKMGMDEEVCIDPTLSPPGKSNEAMERMSSAAEDLMGGALSGMVTPGQRELHALKGVALKRRTKTSASGMAGMFLGNRGEVNEEATSVKEGPIDPNVFRLPEKYKMVDQMKEMREEMQDAQKKMQGMGMPIFPEAEKKGE